MSHLSSLAAVVAYLVSSFIFLRAVLRRDPHPSIWADRCLALGLIFHGAALTLIAMKAGYGMLSDGSDYFMGIAWFLPLSYFAMRRKLHCPIVGAFIAPLATLFLVSSSYFVSLGGTPNSEKGGLPLFLLHVLPAMLAEVVFLLALVVSCVYLIQRRRLKRKAVDSFSIGGPSLELLDTLNYRFVLAGFVLMSLAVISGTLWAVGRNQRLFTADLVQWFGILAWALLALILYIKVHLTWSARRVATITVLLAALYAVALFGAAVAGKNILHGGYHVQRPVQQ